MSASQATARFANSLSMRDSRPVSWLFRRPPIRCLVIGIHDPRCTRVICCIEVTICPSGVSIAQPLAERAPRKTTAAETSMVSAAASVSTVLLSKLHHAAGRHSARHSAARTCALLVRLLGYHALSGEQQARDRRRILQRAANDFGRVDDSSLHQILELLTGRVESERPLVVLDLVDDYRAFPARVRCDPPRRSFDRLLDDRDTDLLGLAGAHVVEHARRANQRDAAAGHHALFARGAGGMQRVFDACLLLFHLDFGRRADANHRDAADQLRQPLLQFLAIVVRGSLLDLGANLLDTTLDVGFL